MSGRTPITDEVLRRVGGNLVIFQHVEHVLSFLAARARFDAPASEFAGRFDKNTNAIGKTTMGSLARSVLDDVLGLNEADEESRAIDETWLKFRFSVETDAETVAQCQAALKDLVKSRNELVHHFLPRWQAAVAEESTAVLAWLDAQRETALSMLERLRAWASTVEEAIKEHAAFLASDQGQRELDLFMLHCTRLVVMLGQVAMATPRADGWMLSTAGHLIQREAPEQLQDLQRRFGHPTLKAILLATELFDVDEEATTKGGTRTIYRINDRWRLQFGPAQPDTASPECQR